MEILELTMEEIEIMISSGEINDAKTIVGIHYITHHNK
jgi:hypothetical protein